MVEFLFKNANQEKLKSVLPLAGITLTLTQLRAKIYEIVTTGSRINNPPPISPVQRELPKFVEQVASSEIKKEENEIQETESDENLADFVKGLSSTLSKRIQMLPVEGAEKNPAPRQGRIRQLLNKEQSKVNEESASE